MRPTVFLLDFKLDSEDEPHLGRLAVDENESNRTLSSAMFGQAIFSSTGKDVLLTAYPTIQDGRRLGLIYCTSKPSAIYCTSIEKDCGGKVGDNEAVTMNAWKPRTWTRLSSPGVSARSARSIPGQDRCIWLQCEEGGAHKHCDALVSYSQEQGTIEIPVFSVPDETTGWAGLYSDTQLPRSCLLRKGALFVTDTIRGCVKVLIAYEFGSKSTPSILTPISGELDLSQTAREKSLIWSYKLLCTDGDSRLVAVRSSTLHPDQLLLGSLQQDGISVRWTIVRDLGTQWEQDKGEKSCSCLEFSSLG
jgi:acylaminoacyl-peptidase